MTVKKEDVKEMTEKAKKTIKESVEKTAKAVKESAQETAAVVAEAAPVMTEAARESVKETAGKAKSAAKKAGARTRTAAKKVSDAAKAESHKRAVSRIEKKVVLQYQGREVEEAALVEAATAAFRESSKAIIKTIELYLKPEENAAYYVVNGSFTGKIDF